MPKRHTPQPLANLREIGGTPWAKNWRGEQSTCTFCLNLATHVADQRVASRYSSEPSKMRRIRLCGIHAAKHRDTITGG